MKKMIRSLLTIALCAGCKLLADEAVDLQTTEITTTTEESTVSCGHLPKQDEPVACSCGGSHRRKKDKSEARCSNCPPKANVAACPNCPPKANVAACPSCPPQTHVAACPNCPPNASLAACSCKSCSCVNCTCGNAVAYNEEPAERCRKKRPPKVEILACGEEIVEGAVACGEEIVEGTVACEEEIIEETVAEA